MMSDERREREIENQQRVQRIRPLKTSNGFFIKKAFIFVRLKTWSFVAFY